nr:MAG TPA: YopX protein [Bacteriophage sp.]
MVIPLEYPIEILGNIYEPTLNVKMPTCTPVGAPVCSPA